MLDYDYNTVKEVMINIKLNGIDKLKSALSKFPQQITHNLAQAGTESAERIVFPTTGLKSYPVSTSPNYIRGRGTQFTRYNDNKSERYGTNFYSRNESTKTFLGNRASYAQWLTDEQLQSQVMASKGWLKMIDVVNDKISSIKSVYESWIQKTIKDLGL